MGSLLGGYAVRATVWIGGGNLPLVPGDSCHYLEVATSVFRGEGPVKHYVESFFTDYPRDPRGPGRARRLGHAAVRVPARRRVSPGRGRARASRSRRPSAVAKACSFVLNLLALPALYGFARRRFGPRVAHWRRWPCSPCCRSTHLRGVRPPREPGGADVDPGGLDADRGLARSGPARRPGPGRLSAGVCGGLAILARNTALALIAAAGLYAA